MDALILRFQSAELIELSRRESLLNCTSSFVLTGAANASEIVNEAKPNACFNKIDRAKTSLGTLAKTLTTFLLMVGASSMAHAAPSIDMSGVVSVMQTVEIACLLIGSIIVLISLIFSVFSFAGGNVMRGITGVAGVLFGGLVIGLGPTWVSSLTGQNV